MIGELKRRVVVERLTEVDNGRGGLVPKYVPVGEFWAGVYPLTINERVRYKEAGVETDVRIVMRYDPDPKRRPNAGCRIVRGFVTYEIVGTIDTLDNEDYIELLGATK